LESTPDLTAHGRRQHLRVENVLDAKGDTKQLSAAIPPGSIQLGVDVAFVETLRKMVPGVERHVSIDGCGVPLPSLTERPPLRNLLFDRLIV